MEVQQLIQKGWKSLNNKDKESYLVHLKNWNQQNSRNERAIELFERLLA